MSRTTSGTQPTWLRALMAAAVGLALAATLLLVVADSDRWLRLAVVAALWAALVASFAVTRSRREARVAELHLAEAERTYQLELLREIHARKEFQAELAERARELNASAQAGELTSIRKSLERLTAVIPALGSGDVLVERLTVSTEATRIRNLSTWPSDGIDEPAVIESGPELPMSPELPVKQELPVEPVTTDRDPDPEAVPVAEREPAVEPEETEPAPSSLEVQPEVEVEAGARDTEAPATETGPDPEPDQEISVSALLAAFGEPAVGTAGRRHRRAAD